MFALSETEGFSQQDIDIMNEAACIIIEKEGDIVLEYSQEIGETICKFINEVPIQMPAKELAKKTLAHLGWA